MEKLMFIIFVLFLIIFNLLSVSMEFTNTYSCFCNVKECGPRPICKSKNLGCFSDLANDSDARTAKHGCLDLLSEEKQSQCQNLPGTVASSVNQMSLLLCCQKDMCNLEPEHFLILNQTMTQELHVNNYYSNQHIWYKTATIAVPICGVLILAMLILVGAKILKSDNIDERILMSKLREKHDQCSSSVSSPNCNINAANIAPLLPPRNPLMGVNVNKLENIIISPTNINLSKTNGNYVKPSTCSTIDYIKPISNTINCIKPMANNNDKIIINSLNTNLYNINSALSNGNSTISNVNSALSNTYNVHTALSNGNAALCNTYNVNSALGNVYNVNSALSNGNSAMSSNNHIKNIKNCNNDFPSEIIIKDLNKASCSNIASCNVYPSHNDTFYSGDVNSQVLSSEKINYKQSLISSWINNENEK